MNASARAIQDYLDSVGMRAAELAVRLRTSKTTICEIQKGRREVSVWLLPKLVAVTGIPAAKLRPDLAALFDPRIPASADGGENSP